MMYVGVGKILWILMIWRVWTVCCFWSFSKIPHKKSQKFLLWKRGYFSQNVDKWFRNQKKRAIPLILLWQLFMMTYGREKRTKHLTLAGHILTRVTWPHGRSLWTHFQSWEQVSSIHLRVSNSSHRTEEPLKYSSVTYRSSVLLTHPTPPSFLSSTMLHNGDSSGPIFRSCNRITVMRTLRQKWSEM